MHRPLLGHVLTVMYFPNFPALGARRLDLSYNGLLEMSEAFGRNQRLETFLARKNLVTIISPDIGPLPALRHLDLGQVSQPIGSLGRKRDAGLLMLLRGTGSANKPDDGAS